MSEKESSFKGITILLKKRKMYMNAQNTTDEFDSNSCLVLGHFDQMKIENIDSWSEWAPYHLEHLSLEDEYIDKYNIKAYFPESKKRENYQKNGMNYDVWHTENDSFPFIVMSVINISNEYAKKILEDNSNILDNLVQLTHSCAESCNLKNNLSEMNIAIFPTIGYSDFILLSKTYDIKSVLTLIETLKQKKIDSSNAAPCLSSVYTMLGFRNRGLNEIDEKHLEGIKLSIRFGLREGVSTSQFKELLNASIDESIKKHYRILGNSDVMVVINSSLNKILPLYFDNETPGVFHPKHNNFKYIRNMRSEIYIDIKDEEVSENLLVDSKQNINVTEYKKKFDDILETLKEFVESTRRPGRIIYAFEDVMKRYLQLIQSKHCFDIEVVIGKAFDNLEKCLKQDIESLKILQESNYNVYDEVDKTFKALNMFREKIGNYLADVQRSDSLFFESNSLSHPSIGSATKLLFFYNQCIDKIKGILAPEDAEKYAFVVLSGGTDKTQVIDLFSHLEPSDEEICSIVLVYIPESSLYDVQSSLFSILHELLHFCGKREREKRLKCITEAFCEYTAIVFGDFFENNQNNFISCNLKQLKNYIDKDKWDKMSFEVDNTIKECTKELKDELKKLIEYKVNDKIKEQKIGKAFYYGRYVYDEMFEIVKEIFLSEDVKIEIYNKNTDYRLKSTQKIINILEKYEIKYSGIHQSIEDLKYKNKYFEKNKVVDNEWNFINCIINLYLGIPINNSEEMNISKDDRNIDLATILQLLEILFKECYADCMSNKVLEGSISQFIFNFLTETRNEYDAFSTEAYIRLRMIIDFKYLFNIQNKLPKDVEKGLDTMLEKMKKRGKSYLETAQITNQLGEILFVGEGERERISALIRPVLEYIEYCFNNWGEDIKGKLEIIRELNNCSAMNNSDDTYKFLNYVTQSWIEYAK